MIPNCHFVSVITCSITLDCVDCSKPGKCQGQALDIFVAKDICECKNSCLNSTEGCAYISWDLINNTCTQTGTCNAIDTSCGEACSYMPNNCGNEGNFARSALK